MTISLPGPAVWAAAASCMLAPLPALADVALPAPYVSRALDAVLLPIDGQVRRSFSLARDDRGVLVLATMPGGVADEYGILPGDVLELVGGRKISTPLELDEVVYYWILEGIFDIDFGIWRDGGPVQVVGSITEESYWEVIEISTIETWSSWESFEEVYSYEEYYAEYSEEVIETWEATETTIEETVTSEEWTEEMTDETSETYEEWSEEVTEEYSEESSDEETVDSSEEIEDESLIDRKSVV